MVSVLPEQDAGITVIAFLTVFQRTVPTPCHESVVGNVLVGITFEPFQSVGRGVAVEGHGTFHIEVVIVRHHVERLAVQFRIGRDCRALPHVVAVLERVKRLVADVRVHQRLQPVVLVFAGLGYLVNYRCRRVFGIDSRPMLFRIVEIFDIIGKTRLRIATMRFHPLAQRVTRF